MFSKSHTKHLKVDSVADLACGTLAGTNPLHNKKPKKEKKELDEDEVAYKAKQQADKKARDEMAKKAQGKGPMNAGQQGIKKSKK